MSKAQATGAGASSIEVGSRVAVWTVTMVAMTVDEFITGLKKPLSCSESGHYLLVFNRNKNSMPELYCAVSRQGETYLVLGALSLCWPS